MSASTTSILDQPGKGVYQHEMFQFPLAALFLLAPVAPAGWFMGGSSGGGSGELEIPEPEAHFVVTVTDDTATSTTLKAFTWEGFIHVQGELGRGTVSIAFTDISRIDFEPGDKGRVTARVALKSGDIVRLSVKGRTMCYGRTGFGNYQIQVKDLRRLQFSNTVKKPQPTPSN